MGSRPSVAVVVATRNRAHKLAGLVEALAQQELSAFEVVIVDDGSDDGTREELIRLAEHAPFPLTPIHLPVNRGPATARNTGWRRSSAPVVVFTDDDCLPQPGWLAGLVAALDDADMVQGRTAPDPERLLLIGPFGHTVDVKAEIGFYETCNIAYRRSLLERLGGFDESFRFPYGEDTDLGWRAKKAGARSAFAADALVHHEVRSSDFLHYLRGLRRRDGLVLAMRNHPEIRRNFPFGLYLDSTHPLSLMVATAFVGILERPRARGRWALFAVASAGYTRACLRTRNWPPRGRGWATALPLALVTDLVDVGVLAAASARYRTFFL